MEVGRGDLKFHYRVSGVALRDGQVLLHRAVTDPFWTLPGGHGEFLEDAAAPESVARRSPGTKEAGGSSEPPALVR